MYRLKTEVVLKQKMKKLIQTNSIVRHIIVYSLQFTVYCLLFMSLLHASEVTRSRIIMGTLVQIKTVNEDMSEEETNKAIDNAFGAV